MSGKISRGLNDRVSALLAFGWAGKTLGRNTSTAAAEDPDDPEALDVPPNDDTGPALLGTAPNWDEDAPPLAFGIIGETLNLALAAAGSSVASFKISSSEDWISQTVDPCNTDWLTVNPQLLA